MERVYTIHRASGCNLTIKTSEAIQNAMDQEKEGIKPMFSWYNWKKHERVTPAGWLVWSTYQDGAGVVYKRPEDGKYIVVTGWQGDFMYGG